MKEFALKTIISTIFYAYLTHIILKVVKCKAHNKLRNQVYTCAKILIQSNRIVGI